MKLYKAAVIGHTGRGDYGHGLDTVYQSMPEIECVAVADADADGLDQAGERLGVPAHRRYRNYREMLQREQPDLVSIGARWLDQHRDMVVAAAEAGVRGIYCEKPLARDLKEADEMLAACDRAGARLCVAHQQRFHPLMQKAKQLIAEGFIGRVYEVYGAGKQDQRGGGEDLLVLGTHTLDLMVHLFGEPRWVQASVLQDGRDAGPGDVHWGNEEIGPIMGDQLHAVYAFADGVLGHFSSHKGGKRFGKRSPGLQIYGSEGILAFRGGYLLHYPDPCWTPADSGDTWQVLGGPQALPGTALNHLLVRDLIAACEENREPLASGRAARWALEMILGVYASHRHGRLPLPLHDRNHPLQDWWTKSSIVKAV